MDTRNWEYRGLQLSNREKLYNFQIQRVDNTINYNTSIYENNINNGAYSTNTTVGVRTIRFFGSIYGTLEQKREAYTKLKEIIKTEDFPSILNRGFYPLKWTDKRGVDVQAQAKVYKPLETEEEDNLLKFTFTLICDDPFYVWQVEKTATGGLGVLGGNMLTNTLTNTLFGGRDYIEVDNEGDTKAGMFLRILGDLTNPRVTNITTGQSMKVQKDTTKLEIDNRDRPFTIFDDGANAKGDKLGDFVYLAPGVNKILISSENYIEESQAQVTIYYRNTYE